MRITCAFLLSLLFYLSHAQQSAIPSLAAASTTTSPPDPDYSIYTAASNIFTVPSASSVENLLPTSPPHDPCGPLIQPHNDIGSTCNVSLLYSPNKPSPFGVQCISPGYPDAPNINFPACIEETIPKICHQLTRPGVQKGKWIWESATPPGACWIGFWLPNDVGAAKPIRDMDECMNNIFTPLVGFCNPMLSPGRYNLRLVNIKKAPDYTQTGSQVDAGYPSYILSTRELTGRELKL